MTTMPGRDRSGCTDDQDPGKLPNLAHLMDNPNNAITGKGQISALELR